MVYDGSVRGSIRTGLNEPQRETLSRFENVNQPSEWMRGQLAAMRLCSPTADERQRMAAILNRWEQQ